MKGLHRNFVIVLTGLALIASGLQSCKSHRHLTRSVSKPIEKLNADESVIVFERLQTQVNDFSNLQVRGKAQLTWQGKDQQEVNVQIRMIKGKAIWISATAFLGTEVGRLLITPEQVQIMNRMEGTFARIPFSDLLNSLDFDVLQNVLAALPVFDSSSLSQVEISKNQTEFHILHQGLPGDGKEPNRWEQWLDQQTLQSETIRFSNSEGKQFQAVYDWEKSLSAEEGPYRYPNRFSMDVISTALNLQCTLHIEKVQAPENLTLPFTIPNNYIQVNVLQFN